jgi:tRNA-dihydrouridine synthase B
MQIGCYSLPSNVFAAPMAGVTDLPFRRLCKNFGAGLAVSEMISAKPETWSSDKTRARINHAGEVEPRSVQIAGADPALMAAAARYNVERGAQIIDINMGCPAKKVCNVMAGSALLRDEALVASIVGAVVRAVDVPVTLKIRTGWDKDNRNAVRVAHIAREEGVQALAMHGRTRACGFGGAAEYDTIAAVKAAVALPLIANGDIRTPQQAKQVLDYTGAQAIMIGRAAQGRPWIFRESNHYLATNELLPPPEVGEIRQALMAHLHDLHEFYGGEKGVRIARKHIQWYTKDLAGGKQFWIEVSEVKSAQQQLQMVRRFFDQLAELDTRLAYTGNEGEALTA